jgi:hypothetical protein
MRVTVGYSGETAELDVPEGRLAGAWRGPDGVAPRDLPGLVREALENPRDFPPLRRTVVPGDRVAIPLGPAVPDADIILAEVVAILREAGVEPEGITVLAAPGAHAPGTLHLPAGVTRIDHDPDDRARMAYLASTAAGRRVYLDRMLTDADVVLPIGRLAYDPVLGYDGPWGAIFPGLSDRETVRAAAAGALASLPEPGDRVPLFDEAAEVGWLLGSLFHVAVAPGVRGVAGIVAGREDLVRADGVRAIQDAWSVATDAWAELVVAGIGVAGVPSTLDDLSVGLQGALDLIRPGGASRIVALSEIAEVPEPVAGSPTSARLDRVLEGAAVYLLSRLDPEVVEDLGMVPVARLADVQRLVAASGSCLLLSPADRLRVTRSEA